MAEKAGGYRRARRALVRDLEHIANNLAGPYRITPEALAWGTEWYTRHDKERQDNGADEAFANYMSRKQTHIHKLAMILAAAQSDTMVVDLPHLVLAHTMISDLEQDMPKVFAKIGRSDDSLHVEKFLTFIRQRQTVPYDEAYESGFEDMPRRVPDLTKVHRLIGYRPQYTLDDILNQVIDYFRRR